MSALRVIYFGAWSRTLVGHFHYGPGGRWLRREDIPPHLDSIDTRYPPGGTAETGKDSVYGADQTEGKATLRHVGGWTVVAFWDRSADGRMNSNSAFLLHGAYDFDGAVTAARAAFPEVFARFPFAVVPAATTVPV